MKKNNQYDLIFQKEADANKFDWLLLKAQVKAESNFNPSAVSPAGAQGLAQFMPPTWSDWGKGDPFDAASSIKAQAKYMKWLNELIKRTTNTTVNLTEWTLAAYNWGIGNVQKQIRKHGGNYQLAYLEFPKETQNYIKKIESFYKEYKGLEKANEQY